MSKYEPPTLNGSEDYKEIKRQEMIIIELICVMFWYIYLKELYF